MSTIPTNRSIKIKQVAHLTIPNAQGPQVISISGHHVSNMRHRKSRPMAYLT